MVSVNLTEARRRLNELVDIAQQGEFVVITRCGKEVARLVPPVSPNRPRLPDLSSFRSSVKVKGKSLCRDVITMRAEGRY